MRLRTLPAPPVATVLPVVTVLLALMGLTLAAPARAASGPAVGETTLSGPGHALVGAEIGYLTATVHLSSPTGIQVGTTPMNPVPMVDGYPQSTCPCVQVVRSAPATYPQSWGWLQVPLVLTSGTAQDGVWTARAPVTASSAGTWRLTRVTLDGAGQAVDFPFARARQPSASVTGTDPVVLSVTPVTHLPVRAGASVRYRVAARLRTSGEPVAGVRLGVFSAQAECTDYEPPSYVRTGADGTATWTMSGRSPGSAIIVWRPLAGSGVRGTIPPGESLCSETFPYTASMTAVPAHARVRAGTDVVVTGRLSALCYEAAPVLQRLVGRSWRTVNTSTTRLSSTASTSGCSYRTVATPRRGTSTYRVAALATLTGLRSAVSPSFRLTGR
ncbi:hypothetical protein [Motilibacter rhizosphaerae]|uniref:hypothetical protein n=1 Tax=Motilibacter rhizosphaerae TaxID=598652 RepID=UPI00102D1A60|nr:hypothetical protein [Motilibacter rhizosphaerae]